MPHLTSFEGYEAKSLGTALDIICDAYSLPLSHVLTHEKLHRGNMKYIYPQPADAQANDAINVPLEAAIEEPKLKIVTSTGEIKVFSEPASEDEYPLAAVGD